MTKFLALAIVAAGAVAGPASARPDEGSAKLTKLESGYLHASAGGSILEGDPAIAARIAVGAGAEAGAQGSGGVTPTNLARAVEWQTPGGVTPTNLARAYDPRGVVEPALIRDVPDGYVGGGKTSDPVTVFVSDDGGSFDERALVLGFGLGSALVAAAVAVLMLSRGRMRLA